MIRSSATGTRTPGICVTGRDVTNYTIADDKLYYIIKTDKSLLTGFEPATSGLEVQCAIHCATRATYLLY